MTFSYLKISPDSSSSVRTPHTSVWCYKWRSIRVQDQVHLLLSSQPDSFTRCNPFTRQPDQHENYSLVGQPTIVMSHYLHGVSHSFIYLTMLHNDISCLPLPLPLPLSFTLSFPAHLHSLALILFPICINLEEDPTPHSPTRGVHSGVR